MTPTYKLRLSFKSLFRRDKIFKDAISHVFPTELQGNLLTIETEDHATYLFNVNDIGCLEVDKKVFLLRVEALERESAGAFEAKKHLNS